MAHKKRLDVLVAERFPAYSRRQIQSWIMQGKVKVDGQIVTKGGVAVSEDAPIDLDVQEPKFVSRAGFKLEGALDYFKLDVTGFVVMDAGISTGGFTDCLLQRGARKIYGIDVGRAQVHEKIAQDPRVVVMEQTNLRYVTDLGEKVDLVTLDLSFISVLKVMDAVCAVLKDNGNLIVLVKPQFESQKHEIGRGGIVRDDAVREIIVQRTIDGVVARGFTFIGVIESPIEGATGNREYLAYFRRSPII